MEKRAVIVGATSGIGYEVARLLIEQGWIVGVAGRRVEQLKALKEMAPERVCVGFVDVTHPHADRFLGGLIHDMEGTDLILISAGIGFQNPELDSEVELDTADTNVVGWMRIINIAFQCFKRNGRGHIAAITSIAGTKGLGVAPAYSATKRFQSHYLEALEQLARMQGLDIAFTDIRPGFVATDLLGDGHHYPMQLHPEAVARTIVKAIKRKKRVVVVDWRYALLVFFWRLIPQWLWVRMNIHTKKK